MCWEGHLRAPPPEIHLYTLQGAQRLPARPPALPVHEVRRVFGVRTQTATHQLPRVLARHEAAACRSVNVRPRKARSNVHRVRRTVRLPAPPDRVCVPRVPRQQHLPTRAASRSLCGLCRDVQARGAAGLVPSVSRKSVRTRQRMVQVPAVCRRERVPARPGALPLLRVPRCCAGAAGRRALPPRPPAVNVRGVWRHWALRTRSHPQLLRRMLWRRGVRARAASLRLRGVRWRKHVRARPSPRALPAVQCVVFQPVVRSSHQCHLVFGHFSASTLVTRRKFVFPSCIVVGWVVVELSFWQCHG